MIFFGTSQFSIHVLDKLKELSVFPDVIATVPDRPSGRKMHMTPPPVKIWAQQNNIKCLQFEKLNDEAVGILSEVENERPDIFIVASYGKIIPKKVLDIPLYGCLNIHPSLLPKYRGATPLQTSIIEDQKTTGVTIIKMDELMDHGPIISQWSDKIPNWPININQLEKLLAYKSAEILADVLPQYIAGGIVPKEQKHDEATFTKKISKEDGLIDQSLINKNGQISGADGYNIYLRYLALYNWPGLHFFIKKNESSKMIRVKVRDISWDKESSQLNINKVTPEGRSDMSWRDFVNFIKTLSTSSFF
jgi:methionyl-tRNA formyltransferase